MLHRVAYQMQAVEKGLAGNLIAADELERILTDYLKTLDINNPRAVARVMIKQLRERNFILCFMGADYYAFVHRTFLEYFCAWEYVRQFEKKQTISRDKLKTEVFGKHWQDESWHEVLRLIVGMIEPKLAGEIIDYLRNQPGEEEQFINVFLAADCLSEVRNRSVIASTATQLINQIKGLIQYDLSYYYKPYGEDFRLVREIRTQAVAAIATTWHDSPDTLPWLKQKVKSDDDETVRYAAVKEIAKGWKDDPDTLPWLKQKALSDDHWDVRCAAVQELTKGWKDEPWLFKLLRDRALNDPFVREDDLQFHPRQLALKIIIKQYPDHPQTLPLLRDRAENDPDDKVRNFAQNKLAKLEKKKAIYDIILNINFVYTIQSKQR
ncbi:MAG: HEAT repeat domain-containing protein [Coleofasciculus sp. C1-SOL-03]|uniref:NACHT domain-containing protein n=1 Tax=Coleofasciculus sp. C1-SOL-03 TaxID=3069522 RepID=UPI0032FF22AB